MNITFQIPGGEAIADAHNAALTVSVQSGSRFCGRYFDTDNDGVVYTTTVCS